MLIYIRKKKSAISRNTAHLSNQKREAGDKVYVLDPRKRCHSEVPVKLARVFFSARVDF